MKNCLLFGLAAALLFATSAGTSLWLQNRNKNGGDKRRGLINAEADTGDEQFVSRSAKPGGDESAQPAPNPHEHEKTLADRETALSQREKRMDLIARDIQKERAALEDLQKQIQDALREVGTKSGVAAAPKSDADIRREGAARDEAQIRAHLRDSDAADGTDVALLAVELEKLAPELAARRLKDLGDRRATVVLDKMDATFRQRVLDAARANPETPTTAPALPMSPTPPPVVPTPPFPIR
jgi:hypothetical protein